MREGPVAWRLRELRGEWQITPRQREVLALLVRGQTNKEIAGVLDCSPRTVELHVRELLRKAGCERRTNLIAAFWRGMDEP